MRISKVSLHAVYLVSLGQVPELEVQAVVAAAASGTFGPVAVVDEVVVVLAVAVESVVLEACLVVAGGLEVPRKLPTKLGLLWASRSLLRSLAAIVGNLASRSAAIRWTDPWPGTGNLVSAGVLSRFQLKLGSGACSCAGAGAAAVACLRFLWTSTSVFVSWVSTSSISGCSCGWRRAGLRGVASCGSSM